MICGDLGSRLPSVGDNRLKYLGGNDPSSLETLRWGFSQRCPSVLQLKAGSTIQALPFFTSVSRI